MCHSEKDQYIEKLLPFEYEVDFPQIVEDFFGEDYIKTFSEYSKKDIEEVILVYTECIAKGYYYSKSALFAGDYDNMTSIKPKNAILNIKKIMAELPATILLMADVFEKEHLLKVCSALLFLRVLKGSFTKKVSKEEAVVFVHLWNVSSEEITVEGTYEGSKTAMKQLCQKEITLDEYNNILDGLEFISAIKILGNGEIKLCETVEMKKLFD